MTEEPNEYRVQVARAEQGWEVQVLKPGGEVALTRACSSEAEARTFASTVEQHIAWLSPRKFAEYYRLS